MSGKDEPKKDDGKNSGKSERQGANDGGVGVGGGYEPSARDWEIFRKWQDGVYTMSELAYQFKLAKSTVWAIIHKVEKFSASFHATEIQNIRIRVFERCELLWALSMQSFALSLQDETTVTKVEGGESGTITTTTVRGSSGSPAFIHTALASQQEVMRIFGAYAPKVAKQTGSNALRTGGRTPLEAINARIEALLQFQQKLAEQERLQAPAVEQAAS